jgi:tetratricopeptide (TPR) repeat protein
MGKKGMGIIVSVGLMMMMGMTFMTLEALGQVSTPLEEGIRQYNADNYEEAVELLTEARKMDPRSTKAAYMMAYKQQNGFEEAVPHFRDAVSFAPPYKEALIDLIDALSRINRTEEARKWIAVAEREKILPAKTAFLKGIILVKEGKYPESVEAFEQSKQLDPTPANTQIANFQIGLAYMMDRKFRQAGERFRATITQDETSDLASFARRYKDLMDQRGWAERPLRLTLSVLGQYDTNMIQEPYAVGKLPDAGEQQSLAMLNTARLDYVPSLPNNWLFNAGYAFSSNVHEKHVHTHDVMVHNFNIAPGYNFGRYAVNVLVNYADVYKRNPGYGRYSGTLSSGPVFRFVLTEEQNHILELYGGYVKKSYHRAPLDRNENQNSTGLNSYLSWMWLFKNGAMLNMKYGYQKENAEGNNWTNEGHRFTVNSLVPVVGDLKLQLGGECFVQDYSNESTISAFNREKRRDRTYTGMAGLTWEVNRHLRLMAMYTGTRAASNIYVYDYDRSIYSAGAEIRF